MSLLPRLVLVACVLLCSSLSAEAFPPTWLPAFAPPPPTPVPYYTAPIATAPTPAPYVAPAPVIAPTPIPWYPVATAPVWIPAPAPINRCGNLICEANEILLGSAAFCPTDCPTAFVPTPVPTPTNLCGNFICEANEFILGSYYCPADCAPTPTPPAGPAKDEDGCIITSELEARMRLRMEFQVRPVTKQAYEQVISGQDPMDAWNESLFRSTKLGRLKDPVTTLCNMKVAKKAGITHVVSLMGNSPQGGQEILVNAEEKAAAAKVGISFVEVEEADWTEFENQNFVELEEGEEPPAVAELPDDGTPAIAEAPDTQPVGLYIPAHYRSNETMDRLTINRTNAALTTLGNLAGGGSKVVFHCWHGKDRTGLLAGLYLLRNGGLTPPPPMPAMVGMPGMGTLAHEVYTRYMLGYTVGGLQFSTEFATLNNAWTHFAAP